MKKFLVSILVLIGLLGTSISYGDFGTCPFGDCESGSGGATWTTSFGTPPNIVTNYPGWIAWKDNRVAQFEAHCPLARTTTYYFSKETGASDSNNCSLMAPCLTEAKAVTLLADDVRIRFRRGDTWSEAGVTLNTTKRVTIDSYGDMAAARPLLNLFTKAYTSGWTNVPATNAYTRTEASDIAYVREATDRFGETRGTHLIRGSSLVDVQTRANSYYYDVGTTTLTVNLNGDDPNTKSLEAVISNTTIGIGLSADGSRAEEIRADGYGMSRTNSATQAEGFHSSAEGNAAVYFKNVEAYFCSSHCVAHYAGATTQQGGKAMFNGATTGFPMYNSGGETSQNTYARDGGQETWFLNGVIKYGTISTTDWTFATTFKRGIGIYGHTSGTTFKVALIVKFNMVVPSTSYSQVAVLSQQADTPTTVITSPTEAVYFLVNSQYLSNTQAAGNGIDLTSNGVIYGNVFKFKVQAIANNNGWAANSPKYVWLVNNYFEADLTALSTTSFTFWNSPGTAKTNDNITYWWNNQIKFTNNATSGAQGLDGDSCNDTDNAPSATADNRNGEFINNIISYSSVNASSLFCFSNYATKQKNNAYYRVSDHVGKTRGYNLDPAKQTPGSEPVFGTCQSQFTGTGTATTHTVGYDIFGVARTALDLGPFKCS